MPKSEKERIAVLELQSKANAADISEIKSDVKTLVKFTSQVKGGGKFLGGVALAVPCIIAIAAWATPA